MGLVNVFRAGVGGGADASGVGGVGSAEQPAAKAAARIARRVEITFIPVRTAGTGPVLPRDGRALAVGRVVVTTPAMQHRKTWLAAAAVAFTIASSVAFVSAQDKPAATTRPAAAPG